MRAAGVVGWGLCVPGTGGSEGESSPGITGAAAGSVAAAGAAVPGSAVVAAAAGFAAGCGTAGGPGGRSRRSGGPSWPGWRGGHWRWAGWGSPPLQAAASARYSSAWWEVGWPRSGWRPEDATPRSSGSAGAAPWRGTPGWSPALAGWSQALRALCSAHLHSANKHINTVTVTTQHLIRHFSPSSTDHN